MKFFFKSTSNWSTVISLFSGYIYIISQNECVTSMATNNPATEWICHQNWKQVPKTKVVDAMLAGTKAWG